MSFDFYVDIFYFFVLIICMGGEIGKVYCGNRGLIMILNVFVRAYFL